MPNLQLSVTAVKLQHRVDGAKQHLFSWHVKFFLGRGLACGILNSNVRLESAGTRAPSHVHRSNK